MKKELTALCLISAVVTGCALMSGKASTDWSPPKQIKYDVFREQGLKACRKIGMGTLTGLVSAGQGEVFCQRKDFKGYYQIQAVAEKNKDKDTVKSVNISVNGMFGAILPASDSEAQKITEDFLQALKNAIESD